MNSWLWKGVITVTVSLCNEVSIGPHPGHKLPGKDEGERAEAVGMCRNQERPFPVSGRLGTQAVWSGEA